MEKTFEEIVFEKLEEILERLDVLEEAVRNVSTPGRDYDVYETE